MAAAYSVDLRERVLAAYNTGQYCLTEVAGMFRVSVAWIKNMRALLAETGSLKPRPRGAGRRPRLDEEQRARLRELVANQPDLTLAELQQQLPVRVSVSTLSATLIQLGLTRKKSRFTRASRTGPTLSKSALIFAPGSRTSTFRSSFSSTKRGHTPR